MLAFRFFESRYGCTNGYKKRFAYGSGRAVLATVMPRCPSAPKFYFLCCIVATRVLNSMLRPLLDAWQRSDERAKRLFANTLIKDELHNEPNLGQVADTGSPAELFVETTRKRIISLSLSYIETLDDVRSCHMLTRTEISCRISDSAARNSGKKIKKARRLISILRCKR